MVPVLVKKMREQWELGLRTDEEYSVDSQIDFSPPVRQELTTHYLDECRNPDLTVYDVYDRVDLAHSKIQEDFHQLRAMVLY